MTDIKSQPKKVGESMLIARLESFGLSSSEAAVYVYLLERGGETGGSNIAVGTGLHRQYVYLALPKLVELGLVEELPKGKQKKYKARPPIEVEKIGRKRALEAGDLARDLNVISTIGNEQEFEVIQGKQAIQQYEMNYAESATERDEDFIIGGASSEFSEIMDDALDEYLSEKDAKSIHVKYLGVPEERKYYEKYTSSYPNQEFRFLEKLPQGTAHMIIRSNEVCFYTFLKPPLVYVVKSPIVAEHYKKFFMMLWEMAE